jgi:hypothetical protein
MATSLSLVLVCLPAPSALIKTLPYETQLLKIKAYLYVHVGLSLLAAMHTLCLEDCGIVPVLESLLC